MQVSILQLTTLQNLAEAHLNEVDFGECFIASRLLNVKNGDDVFVIEVSEQLHFS